MHQICYIFGRFKLLDAQFVKHFYQFAVKRLVATDGLTQGDIHDFVVAHANHNIALSLLYGLDSSNASTRRKNTVVRARASAALQVAKNRHAHVILRELLAHALCIEHCATLRTFRNNHDAALLRLADATLHEARQLVDIGRILRNDGCLSAAGNGRVLCEESGITSHHFNKEDTLMALRCVADAVNTLYNGVHCSIISDS